MALHNSGPLSASDINLELGRPSTTAIDFNQTEIRTLAGKIGGNTPISLADFYGRSSDPNSQLFTITVAEDILPDLTYRGYHSPDDTGAIRNSYLAGFTVVAAYVNVNYPAGTNFFQVQLSGNASGRTLRITPENYGSTLGPVNGSLIAGNTFYWIGLPNNNLFNNWTAGSTRTCHLELSP